MYQQFIRVIAVLGVAFLSSCDFTIDKPIDLSESSKQMVINAYFSPSEPWKIVVTESAPIFSTFNADSLNAITNATVMISENGTFLTSLPYLDSCQCYYSTTNLPQAGNSYTLEVSSPSYEETAISTEYLPHPPKLSDYELLDIRSVETFNTTDYQFFKFSFLDVDDNDNYFVLNTSFETDEQLYVAGCFASKSPLLPKSDFFGEINSTAIFCNTYIKDDILGQQLFELEAGYQIDNKSGLEAEDVYFNIHTFGEAYQYIISSDLARISNGAFFTEPVAIYSNIENALGIFAGYSTAKLKIE